MKAPDAVRLALMMALLVTLLVATQGAEAAVTILSPQEGQVVHGLVTIEANKSDPGDGWLSMRITPTSRQYLIAGLAPLSFTWNTQERDDSGRQRYRDGEYTVEVVAYDAAGRQQERAEAKVTVKNSLDLTEVGEQVLLQTHYSRGDVYLYELQASQTVDVPGRAGSMLRNPPKEAAAPAASPYGGYGGGYGGGAIGGGSVAEVEVPTPGDTEGIPSNIKMKGDAQWTAEVLSPSATGRAVVDADLRRGYYTVTWQWPKQVNEDAEWESNVSDNFSGWLPGNQVARPREGQLYRVKILQTGMVEPMRASAGMAGFPMGYLFIELPQDPVEAGATWNGKMGVITGLTDTTPRIMEAAFKLEGFEYRGMHRCARITTTVTESDVQIPWDLPGTTKSTPGAPGAPGAAPGGLAEGMFDAVRQYAEALGEAMDGGAPPSAGMTPLPGGGGQLGGKAAAGPAGEPEGTLKGDITIKRVAYFDIDAGRFIGFEDSITKKITKILLPPEEGMTGFGSAAAAAAAAKGKLEYRDLYHVDAEKLMGGLVGAGAPALGGGVGGESFQPTSPAAGGFGGPGGYPGFGGASAGGMAAAVRPVRANINISTDLTVEEVKQVAGHAVAQF